MCRFYLQCFDTVGCVGEKYCSKFPVISKMAWWCVCFCVQIVVGTTFNDVVNDVTKDVLIFFHSSWCDECPGINMKLQKVAKKVDH